ncbi:hypothetical protein ROHU_000033 [Labeo rohita]|uniref:Uncharacterized protein n=1 Tax=Labeo rohita TaxID=84645 RepID=A0A498P4L1_LABRO|nr:hypothetical protein ROHU_000033 [Labeo rohita]
MSTSIIFLSVLLSTSIIFLSFLMSTSIIFLSVLLSIFIIFFSFLNYISIVFLSFLICIYIIFLSLLLFTFFVAFKFALLFSRIWKMNLKQMYTKDSFKDLVMKKNLFLLGKDIWNESKGVRVKKKMLDTNEVEAKKARLVSGYA